MSSKYAVVHLNCYQSGQIIPMHKPPNEDKFVYPFEVSGEVTSVVKKTLTINTGDLVCLPADQYQGIQSGAVCVSDVSLFYETRIHEQAAAGTETRPGDKVVAG